MKDLRKKVFSFLSKVLFEGEVERHTNCIYCGSKLKGNQRKFCKDSCNNNYWRRKYAEKRQKKKKLKNLILLKGGLKK